MRKNFARCHEILIHPLVNKFQAENRYWNKKDQHEKQGVRPGFELAPDDQSPGCSAQILQHEPSQAPQGDAHPKDESHQIGMPKSRLKIAGDIGAHYPGYQPKDSNTKSERLDASDVRWRFVIILHYLCCPPEFLAARSASSSFFLSSSFNSAIGAFWLNCSTLM